MKKNGESTITLLKESVPGKIGVVTVTYNSVPVLDDFFASLTVQTYSNFILIAVDSCSDDDSIDMLKSYRKRDCLVLANGANVGIAVGNNQGIREAIEAGCEYVLLLNNDVAFKEDLFANLVTGIEEEQASMAVPMIYFYDAPNRIWAAGGGFQPWLGFRNYHRGENEEDIGQFSSNYLVDFAPACCILIRRDVFARIGLMDERYFVYSDDADFLYRARHEGLLISYLPSAKLWHKVSTLTGGLQSDFTVYHAARGRALFLYKNLGLLKGSFWLGVTYLLYLVRPLLGHDTAHRCREKRRGLRDGVKIALS